MNLLDETISIQKAATWACTTKMVKYRRRYPTPLVQLSRR